MQIGCQHIIIHSALTHASAGHQKAIFHIQLHRTRQALCESGPLTIQASMYGGFEQVGSIGARLPSDDAQITTAAGDVVLYSSNQIVVFYGSNSWAYTRLGRITDRNAAEMAALLGNGNVTITISLEDAGS